MRKQTIVRTATLVLTIANAGLAIAGKSPLPIDDEMLTEVISFCFMTAASLWSWWKNNSFTKEAQEADKYLDSLKGE